jgi:hypothetical protein
MSSLSARRATLDIFLLFAFSVSFLSLQETSILFFVL